MAIKKTEIAKLTTKEAIEKKIAELSLSGIELKAEGRHDKARSIKLSIARLKSAAQNLNTKKSK
ncbi:hypothetical protein HY990_04370 [Candidatus Micrarchaeota archaeon]|nr:hypothetical protein [Candidatus Micrarchaeota archaeon]